MNDKNKVSVDEMDFVSDIKSAILFKKTRFAGALVVLILCLFGSFLFWAHNAKVDEMTTGEAKVIPSSHIKRIQSLEGGIVAEVLVSQGEHVKKGQVLLKLDPTRFASSFREQNQKYFSLQAQIARLKAEVAGNDQIDFPQELLQTRPDLAKREMKLFNSRKQNLGHAIKTLQQNYDLTLKEVNITKPLVKDGVISKIELIRLERQLNDIKGERDEKAEVFKEESQAELNKFSAELSSLAEALVNEKDRMNRTTITSPVNGEIKDVFVNTIGQVVKPGQDIMEILPTEDTLLIEAKIRPSDIGFIHKNQKAVVKITAYDFSIYGGLTGKVVYIAPDTVVDEKDKGQSFYKIRIRTDSNTLSKAKNINRKLEIIPGMTATVHILANKKSILTYLLKPLIKAKQNAFTER